MSDDLRLLIGGRSVIDEGELLHALEDDNERLRADVERLERRARMRKLRARRLAIACAFVASLATWGVAHAEAMTEPASSSARVSRNACRPQHLIDCQHAVSWWRKVAREGEDAIRWQKKERRRMAGEARAELGPLSSWLCIHRGEGAWNDDGPIYKGGLQMDASFSHTYGADMFRKYGDDPHVWTPRDQIIVAERARKVRGFKPWPNTARACGLLA